MSESSKDSYEEQLHQLFSSCDSEQCGFLDRSQLYELSEKLQLDEEQTGYIVDNLICDEFSKVNFDEFKEVFVSLLTQSQLFNTSTTNSYTTSESVLEKDVFKRTHSTLNNLTTNSTPIDNSKKMTSYHLDGDELCNRKTNSRTTSQSNRRCKKSKKSATFSFDTSYKENDNQENKHTIKKNKNVNKSNSTHKNKNVNIDKEPTMNQEHQTTRKTNLNDQLSNQSNKKMRNSSSGTEEGYSSLDDCGSTTSSSNAASPDLVGLSHDEEKVDHSDEKLHHLHLYRSHHILNSGNQKDDHNTDNQSDDLDVNSSDDHSTASSSDLNLSPNNELNNSNATSDLNHQDELEQSTEQYLGSIFEQLNVGKEGYLTLQELFIVCEHTMGLMDEELVKQLFERLDEDKDGKISFDELLKQLTSSSTTTNLTNSGLSCEDLNKMEQYQTNYQADSYASTNDKVPSQKINDSQFDYVNNENNLNELNCSEQNRVINRMNTEAAEKSTIHHQQKKSSLSLELSSYSSYKNYLNTHEMIHESSPDERSNDSKENADNVDNADASNSYYSLDSKLVNQKSTSNKPASKHQRTNSFTSTADFSNVSSINSSTGQSVNSLSCYCHSNVKNCLNNQSKSDYGYSNSNSRVFSHKRTNSHHHSQQHCFKNCNKLTNTSSTNSSINSSSNEATFNQAASNLSSISEQQPNSLCDLNKPCNQVNCCCLTDQAGKKSDQESDQGDILNRRRFSASSNVSSNVSTSELERTQLLSSLNSIHQFNSSHLYHHHSSKEHHLDHLSQQTDEEDDFCNLSGFGSNLLSLDPFAYGYIKVSNLLNLWEQLGICNGKLVLEEMGLSSKVNRIQNSEFLTMLEDALRCSINSIPFPANRDLFHAVFATIRHEYKYLRQNYDQVKEERDNLVEQLRTSIMEANNRADLLAQEVDENHMKLEQSTQNKLLLMEKKYQEQLKYLQDEIQNEREIVNMQMNRLRSDCDQQAQHMQQINVKLKDYSSQLEQENKRLDKELTQCTNRLQEADKCNNEIQRELQDAIVIKKKLTELESMQSLLREREYDSLVAKVDLTRKENKELQDKNDELLMELEQVRSQLAKQESKRRNRRRNNSSEEENDLINYDSQQLNKLFFVAQPIARRPSKDGNLTNWQSHCVAQSFFAGN